MTSTTSRGPEVSSKWKNWSFGSATVDHQAQATGPTMKWNMSVTELVAGRNCVFLLPLSQSLTFTVLSEPKPVMLTRTRDSRPRSRPRTWIPRPRPRPKDLSHKAKANAKDLDFGLKDQGQGQGLTSLA